MYLQYWPVESLQPLYNLLDRQVEEHELPLCLEKKIGVITYSSLARGLLTGKYTPDQTFTDMRANHERFKGEKFRPILEAVKSLQPYADAYGLTIPQLAIRWILTHPAVTSAIVGVKKPEHIESIAPAGDGVLQNRDSYKIANAMAGVR